MDRVADLQLTDWLLVLFTFALVIATLLLWWSTHRLWSSAEKQLGIAKTAADAAKQSAEAAASANKLNEAIFTTANRPWLSAQVVPSWPLTYTDVDGWYFQIQYTLHNHGNSPAVGTSVSAAMIPFVLNAWTTEQLNGRSVFEMPTLGTNPETEFQRLIDGASVPGRLPFFGKTIFPGQGLSERFGIHANRALFEKAKELPSYSGHFVFLFCVSYGSAFAEPRYVTAKGFQLFKAPDEHGQYPKISLAGETVDLSRLLFVPFPHVKTDYAT